MKTPLTILALFVTILGCAQQSSKVELIAGLRSGSGYSQLSIVYPYGTLSDSNGIPIAKGKYVQNQSGFYVPGKLELMLGYKGFRFGYMFGYTYTQYISGTLKLKPKNANVPATYFNSELLLHTFSHMVRIEYNWPIRVKAAKLLVGLNAGFGGYHGNSNNKKNGLKSDYSIYKNRIVATAGVNFEIEKGPISVVISPTYQYQDFQTKQPFFGTVSQHNFGVDIGLRVSLLKLLAKKQDNAQPLAKPQQKH